MRAALRAVLIALLLLTSQGVAATDSRSLDDNPWRYLSLDVPLSWISARWEAERVNHVLDILFALGECSCEKARAILETDLRKSQNALEREINTIQDAESKGKVVNEWIVFVEQKPSRVLAAEAQQRAQQYWSSRRTKSNANQAN